MSYSDLISDARGLLKTIPASYPIMLSFYGPAGYDWNGSRSRNPAGIGSYVHIDETLDALNKKIVYNLQFIFDNLIESREPVWNDTLQRYTSRGETETYYSLNGYANAALQIEELDTTSDEPAWIPHYDLYYCRSNLYDLIPKANEGKYLTKVTARLKSNLEKVCKKYQAEYESWVKTASETVSWTDSTTDTDGTETTTTGSYTIRWYRNGNFPNSASAFCLPSWQEIMQSSTDTEGNTTTHGTGVYHWGPASPTGDTGAYIASGESGPEEVGTFPADKYFWSESKQKEAHNAIVNQVVSVIQELVTDFNRISTTIIDIMELFDTYSNAIALFNTFLMDEDKVYLEDTTKAVPIWKKIDKTGFSRYNTHVGNAYELYITTCQTYDDNFSDKAKWERSQLMSKIAQHHIMTDLDYWNKAWDWYSTIKELRAKRSI